MPLKLKWQGDYVIVKLLGVDTNLFSIWGLRKSVRHSLHTSASGTAESLPDALHKGSVMSVCRAGRKHTKSVAANRGRDFTSTGPLTVIGKIAALSCRDTQMTLGNYQQQLLHISLVSLSRIPQCTCSQNKIYQPFSLAHKLGCLVPAHACLCLWSRTIAGGWGHLCFKDVVYIMKLNDSCNAISMDTLQST